MEVKADQSKSKSKEKEVLGGGGGGNDDSVIRSQDDTTPASFIHEHVPDGWPGFIFDDRKPLSREQRERIHNIEQAATNVHKVVQKYASAPLPSLDPNDDKKSGSKIKHDSAWADASNAVNEIVTAREELVKAWDTGEGTSDSGATETLEEEPWWKPILSGESTTAKSYAGANERKEDSTKCREIADLTQQEEDKFQEVHMEWATDAFAKELEALRTGQLETMSSRKQKKGSTKKEEREDLSAYGLSIVLSSEHSGSWGQDACKDAAVEKEEINAMSDLRLIAEMVQSGSNFFSNDEKKMLIRARQRALASPAGEDGRDGGISLHERRRREARS